jgi:hypothetical protein
MWQGWSVHSCVDGKKQKPPDNDAFPQDDTVTAVAVMFTATVTVVAAAAVRDPLYKACNAVQLKS